MTKNKYKWVLGFKYINPASYLLQTCLSFLSLCLSCPGTQKSKGRATYVIKMLTTKLATSGNRNKKNNDPRPHNNQQSGVQRTECLVTVR